MNIKTILISILVIFASFSCIKKDENHNIDENKKEYNLIACYDEIWVNPCWSVRDNDSTIISNVREYLSKDSISAYEISIAKDGIIEDCKVANCKTGRRIKATIKNTDLKKIQELGFYECK